MKISILIIFLLGFLNCIQGQTGKQIITKIENTNHKKRNKSIDLKALKIERKINNKSLEQLSLFYPDNLVIKIFKNKQEFKKLEFEITEKENYDEYNKKVIVYLENNSPILINENIKQKNFFLVDGVNKKTGKYGSAKMVSENAISPKIYIYDWNKPEVMILGENYDEEFNDEYPEYYKMIETILTDLKRHILELSKQ